MIWTRKKTILAASSGVAVAAIAASVGLIISNMTAVPKPAPRPSATVPAQLFSPFTGERVDKLGPVLAVKIDNIVHARPQTGLNKADIVYVIPVEGGLTRFLAIFSSQFPPVVGPVRSAREDDIELLRQFGRPAFAFSGAQPHLLPVVERARIVDLYSGRVSGYYRSAARIAPYNLYARTSKLLAEARGASTAHSIGFVFGAAPSGGRIAKSFSVSYPAASYRFTWSAADGRWLVWMDGARAMTTDAGRMRAATVVIQHTTVRKSRFIEWGALPPYAETVGHGTAQVLRDGKIYQATWSRPSADEGTTFTTDSGQPMKFATGPVWIVLVGN